MIIVKLCFTDASLTHKEQHEIGLSLRDSLIRVFLPYLTFPEFAVKENGKPYLVNSDASYSVSHTEGCVMCALRCRRDEHSYLPQKLSDTVKEDGIYLVDLTDGLGEIGCDAEILSDDRSDSRLLSIADRYFTDEENTRLRASSSIKHDFYKLWTAKESMIKCSGIGLSGLSRADTASLDSKYKIYSFDIENGERKYSASICAEL